MQPSRGTKKTVNHKTTQYNAGPYVGAVTRLEAGRQLMAHKLSGGPESLHLSLPQQVGPPLLGRGLQKQVIHAAGEASPLQVQCQ